MDVGKVPMELLADLLGQVKVRDPRVLLGPQVGADAAVLDLGDRVLVAKADPVTFATELIGWYAVQVNANDVACLGARPRWFLVTLLLPEGASPSLIQEIFGQVLSACDSLEITLVGGHSEVTARLERPIVAGAMLGEVEKERVVWPAGARPGDALLLTKGIALEGTSLLAREMEGELLKRGVDSALLARARDLLFTPGISVVGDALEACRVARVHAMHDPTEGGLATGLLELARGAGVGLEVDVSAIPVLPECQTICRALELDPLGLLASGALLLAVAPEEATAVTDALAQKGVSARVMGHVTDAAHGLRLRSPDGVKELPRFARDELARLFSQGEAHRAAGC